MADYKFLYFAGATDNTFTQNSAAISGIYFSVGKTTGKITLLDSCNVYSYRVTTGTLDLNDFNHSGGLYSVPSSGTANLYLGTGTITLKGTMYLYDNGGTLNIYPETSTINTGTTSTCYIGFEGTSFDSRTIYNFVWSTQTDELSILGGMTCNSFVENQTDNYHSLYLDPAQTYTFTSLSLGGVSGNETLISASIKNTLSNTSADTWKTLTSTFTGFGQSFTGNGHELVRVVVDLKRIGSPTGIVTAKLYAHSGTFGTSSVPTGAALATSTNTQDVSTISTGGNSYVFLFNNYTITDTTNYVFTIEYTGGTFDGSNYIQYYYGGTVTPSGNVCHYDDGTGWGAWNFDDLRYLIYTQYPATLSQATGTNQFSYLDLSYLTATGGATWIAQNSIDSGGNTGWLFYENIALTPIDAGTATLLAPSITGDANSDLTLINAGSVVTLAPTATGDASVTLSAIALSIAIPEVSVVGDANVAFSSILALTTVFIEPTISVERNWGEQTNGETNWTDSSIESTNWISAVSESTNWNNSIVVITDWTSHNDSSSTWTPVDTLKQS